MKQSLAIILLVLGISASLYAAVETKGLVFFACASDPGSDPEFVWEPVIGVGGALGSTGTAAKPDRRLDPSVPIPAGSSAYYYYFGGDYGSNGGYVNWFDNSQIDFDGTDKFTIEIWMRAEETGLNGDLAVFGTSNKGGTGWCFNTFHNGSRTAGQGTAKLMFRDVTDIQHLYKEGRGYCMTDGVWNHMVMEYDPTPAIGGTGLWPEITVWVNGHPVPGIEEQNGAGEKDPTVDPDFIPDYGITGGLYAGVHPTMPQFSYAGDIAAIRVYDRLLTEAEIDENRGAGPAETITVVGAVAETDGDTAVVEGGATDTFTVVLSSAPSSDVYIDAFFDPNAVSLDETSLVFSTTNWDTPQPIEVTAVDDSQFELAMTTKVEFDVFSYDLSFDGQYVPPVSVAVEDNDSGEVLVSPVNLELSETDETQDTYTIVLTKAPSISSVEITMTYDSADVTVAPDVVTFTSTDWGTAKTITVTAIDDADYESDPHVSVIDHDFTGTIDPSLVGGVDSVGVSIADNDCGPGRYLPGDISGPDGEPDCVVDLYDFSGLAVNWLDCSLPNTDGCVTP